MKAVIMGFNTWRNVSSLSVLSKIQKKWTTIHNTLVERHDDSKKQLNIDGIYGIVVLLDGWIKSFIIKYLLGKSIFYMYS